MNIKHDIGISSLQPLTFVLDRLPDTVNTPNILQGIINILTSILPRWFNITISEITVTRMSTPFMIIFTPMIETMIPAYSNVQSYQERQLSYFLNEDYGSDSLGGNIEGPQDTWHLEEDPPIVLIGQPPETNPNVDIIPIYTSESQRLFIRSSINIERFVGYDIISSDPLVWSALKENNNIPSEIVYYEGAALVRMIDQEESDFLDLQESVDSVKSVVSKLRDSRCFSYSVSQVESSSIPNPELLSTYQEVLSDRIYHSEQLIDIVSEICNAFEFEYLEALSTNKGIGSSVLLLRASKGIADSLGNLNQSSYSKWINDSVTSVLLDRLPQLRVSGSWILLESHLDNLIGITFLATIVYLDELRHCFFQNNGVNLTVLPDLSIIGEFGSLNDVKIFQTTLNGKLIRDDNGNLRLPHLHVEAIPTSLHQILKQEVLDGILSQDTKLSKSMRNRSVISFIYLIKRLLFGKEHPNARTLIISVSPRRSFLVSTATISSDNDIYSLAISAVTINSLRECIIKSLPRMEPSKISQFLDKIISVVNDTPGHNIASVLESLESFQAFCDIFTKDIKINIRECTYVGHNLSRSIEIDGIVSLGTRTNGVTSVGVNLNQNIYHLFDISLKSYTQENMETFSNLVQKLWKSGYFCSTWCKYRYDHSDIYTKLSSYYLRNIPQLRRAVRFPGPAIELIQKQYNILNNV